MKKESFRLCIKTMLILCLWCPFAFSMEEQKLDEIKDELKTTFHIYLGHMPSKTSDVPFDKETSMESIKTDAMSWYPKKWAFIGGITGTGVSLGTGYGMFEVFSQVPSIRNNRWTYTILFPCIFGLVSGMQLGEIYGQRLGGDKEKIISIASGMLSGAALCVILSYCVSQYTSTSLGNETIAGIIAIAEFGILGMVSGANGASYWGKRVGEIRAQNIINQNSEWIEEPYLDLAFQTTQGSDVIYDATTRLRPNRYGWKNRESDAEKLFASSVKIGWLVGGHPNDISSESLNKNNQYDLLFPGQSVNAAGIKDQYASLPFADIKDQYASSSILALSDSNVHISHDKLGISEVFKGTLPRALSIQELIETISTLTSENFFSACSWSGRSQNQSAKIKEAINPGIYTCRLLAKLGVPLQETVLGKFLRPYQDTAPATRELLIGYLYKNRGALKIEPNAELINHMFSEQCGIMNPLNIDYLNVDIEQGLQERERQVKQSIAQKLAARGIASKIINTATGVDWSAHTFQDTGHSLLEINTKDEDQ